MKVTQALITLAVSLFATSTSIAQTVMDGSKIEAGSKAKLASALSLIVPDPFSVQLIGLKENQAGLMCGRFNAKNALGAYTGFRPFVFDPETGKLTPLPDLRGFDIHQPNARQKLEEEEALVNLIKTECPGY